MRALLLLLLLWTTPVSAQAPALPQLGPWTGPVIIAHRGASADRPEHTLAAYRLAIAQGADLIEPDLVPTKDGILVARHENEISETTDVASRPEFASRRATKTIDGVAVTGWFTEDFTLAELKSLRARERLPQLRPANTRYDGQFDVPTFAEVVALAQAESARLGRPIGVYPELKHPSYFEALGFDVITPLLKTLRDAGWTRQSDPVFIQCFELDLLRRLRARTALPLVFLMAAEGAPYDFVLAGDTRRYRDLLSADGLAQIARTVDAIGPQKDVIIPRSADGHLAQPTRLVQEAHRAGLRVHPWTFRPENAFLPTPLRSAGGLDARGDAASEIRAFMATGIDGLFSDSTELAQVVIR
jgi:glycerophosphoryl diester phosphodiesterase